MTSPVPVPVSSFPNATLPLDGTEEVPLVKAGVTSKVPSSAFSVFGGGKLSPEASIAPPAGTLDDVDTLGALHLFVDTTAGDVTITGFEAPTVAPAGTPLLVTVIGGNNLTLPRENAGSDPGNQLLGVGDITIPDGGSQLLYYGDTNSKWCMV